MIPTNPTSERKQMKSLPLRKIKKRAPAPKRRRNQKPSSNPVAELINDPCGANIPSGFYGDDSGYHMRFRNTRSLNAYSNADLTFGYVVWFPDYHNPSRNGSAVASGANLFQWSTTDPTLRPSLAGFGAQVTTNATPPTASSWEDPAYSFVNGTTCQDARTLAACLKIRYTGPTSFAQGNIFPLTNIPLELLLEPPTVQEMMQYANQDVRCDDCLEVKFRPVGRASGNYHRTTANALGVSTSLGPSISSSTEQVGPTAIGFVFYDISEADDVFFDMFKVVEWKPEVNSGIPAKRPNGGFSTELVRSAINFLDKRTPGWDVMVGSIGGNVAGGLATMLRRVVLSGAK